MLHSSTVGKVIPSRSVVIAKDHVVSWNDISDALCEKLGYKHLRDRPAEGGPGFDFWIYWTSRVCDYIPDEVGDDIVDLKDLIECIEDDGFTTPDEDDPKALPILKALVELLPENVVDEGFYVDYC